MGKLVPKMITVMHMCFFGVLMNKIKAHFLSYRLDSLWKRSLHVKKAAQW